MFADFVELPLPGTRNMFCLNRALVGTIMQSSVQVPGDNRKVSIKTGAGTSLYDQNFATTEEANDVYRLIRFGEVQMKLPV